MRPKDFQVRVELAGDLPVLRYLPVAGQPELPAIQLHPFLAVVLERFDAGWENGRVAAELAERVRQPYESVEEIVKDARVCFRGHFARRNGTPIVDLGESVRERFLDELSARDGVLRTRDVVFPGDRSLFPMTLEWLVTRHCNRNCVYCYAGAVPSARAGDATLSRERVMEILAEGVRLGATSFFLTGGEPLLRDDSYDVLVRALELGLNVEILSKQFIPEEAVERLARAGLPKITLSVDSLDPEIAKRMTGVRTFARDITRTIKRLVRHGIRVVVTSVVTRQSVDAIPASLDELERLGVSNVQLNAYSPNLQRHSDDMVLLAEQFDQVAAWARTNKRTMGVYFTSDPSHRKSKEERFRQDHIVCNNGITTLLFLPDGRVSKCDKRLPGGEMIVGDLNEQSVYEVWSSARMIHSLRPPRELYRGSLCYDCEHFDTCHERGRCYYGAYLTSGTLYGPDGSSCPFVEDKVTGLTC